MTVPTTGNHSESVQTEPQPGLEVRDVVKAPIEADDPDAIELAEARALAEREANAGDGKADEADTKNQPAPAATPAAAKPEAPAQAPAAKPEAAKPAGQQDQPMIPKARLDEVLKKQSDLERRNAFLEGALSAQGQLKSGEAAPAAPEPPKRTLDHIDADKVSLAKQFDEGKLSATEWQEKLVELDREARALSAPAPTANQQAGDDLFLEHLTDQLEQKHPYSKLIEEDSHWQFLETEAMRQLAAEGVRIGKSATDTFILRQRMAQLTDVYGPTMTGKSIQKKSAGPAATTTTPPNPAPAKSAAARAEKLDMAARHPADINQLGGSSTNDAGEISEAAILTMSDEEIAALPEATKRRILKSG
jgi:hypothetical protein